MSDLYGEARQTDRWTDTWRETEEESGEWPSAASVQMPCRIAIAKRTGKLRSKADQFLFNNCLVEN